MGLAEDLLAKINNSLDTPIHIPKRNSNLFITKLDRCLGIMTESLDAYLSLIEKPWAFKPDKLMAYLQTAAPDELVDWVNALEIAVVDRGLQNRWILGIAQRTSELNLPQQVRPILAGVLEALNAAPWPTATEFNESEDDTSIEDIFNIIDVSHGLSKVPVEGNWIEIDGQPMRMGGFHKRYNSEDYYWFSNNALLTLPEPGGLTWYGRAKEDEPEWYTPHREVLSARMIEDLFKNGRLKLITDIYEYLNGRGLKPWKSGRQARRQRR